MLSNNGSCETNSKLPQGFGNYLSNEGYVQVIFPKTLFNQVILMKNTITAKTFFIFAEIPILGL